MVAAWQKLFLSGVCVFNNVCGCFKDIFHWILWKKYLRVSFVPLITFEWKQLSCGFVNGPSGRWFTYWALLLWSLNISSRVDMWWLCVPFLKWSTQRCYNGDYQKTNKQIKNKLIYLSQSWKGRLCEQCLVVFFSWLSLCANHCLLKQNKAILSSRMTKHDSLSNYSFSLLFSIQWKWIVKINKVAWIWKNSE